jgi:hypothetical protein
MSFKVRPLTFTTYHVTCQPLKFQLFIAAKQFYGTTCMLRENLPDLEIPVCRVVPIDKFDMMMDIESRHSVPFR